MICGICGAETRREHTCWDCLRVTRQQLRAAKLALAEYAYVRNWRTERVIDWPAPARTVIVWHGTAPGPILAERMLAMITIPAADPPAQLNLAAEDRYAGVEQDNAPADGDGAD